MFKKIIWAILEVATVGIGTYTFVTTMVNEEYVDHEVAGVGAFLIVLGLLLRNWRMTLFIKEANNENSRAIKSETQNKTINTLLILILSFTIFALNRKINDTNWSVSNNESEIENLESKVSEFDDIEYRLDNLETFEERIEHLERYSHGHY